MPHRWLIRILPVLAVALLLVSGLPAQAAAPEPAVPRADALALVTSLFGEPEGMSGPATELQTDGFGPVWVIRWEGLGNREWRPFVTARVDATTGILLGYRTEAEEPVRQPWTVPEPLRYSRAEAEAVAREWTAKLAPDLLSGQLRLREVPSWGGYYRLDDGGHRFAFIITRGGYPTRLELSLTVDARTGNLVSFGRTRQPQATPYLKPALEPDRAVAERTYREQLPWGLQWRQYPVGDSLEWRLVYRLALDYYPDVSLDGHVLDLHGQPLALPETTSGGFLLKGDATYAKPAQPLTRDEVIALAGRLTGRTDPPLSVVAGDYGMGPGDTLQLWTVTWGAEGQPSNFVVIDPVYGLPISLFQAAHAAVPGKAGITADKARSQAAAFLQKVRPDLAGRLELLPGSREPSNGKMPVYSFAWQVLRDGVPLFGRTVQVDVSVTDGAIIRYQMMPYEPIGERFAFRSPERVITPQEAADAYLEAVGLEPAWHLLRRAEGSEAYELGWSPALTWVDAVDAGTGAPLDTSGRDISDLLLQPADIANHPAARSISLLWSAGVLTLDHGRFRPDETASQADLIRWLLLARGGADPTLEMALASGLVRDGEYDPDDLQAPVRRETFAIWAVRAMGYGAVAEMPATICMRFADRTEITPAAANAVALLAGLGAVSGDRFEPERPITRGEAAQILLFVLNDHR